MKGVSVRRAAPEDAEVAIAVVRDSITRLCVADHQNDPVTLESWLRNKTLDNFARWLASADNHLVVAELDSAIAGVASLRSSGEIQLCYVAPGSQRVGIGTALLVALENQARASGLRKLVLNSTTDARPFYERNGYSPSGPPVPGFGRSLCFPYEKAITPLTEVAMDDSDFEGTLVLEQLAAIGKVEDFFDAVDSDDVERATALMKRAKVDAATIATVIRKMEESDGDH